MKIEDLLKAVKAVATKVASLRDELAVAATKADERDLSVRQHTDEALAEVGERIDNVERGVGTRLDEAVQGVNSRIDQAASSADKVANILNRRVDGVIAAIEKQPDVKDVVKRALAEVESGIVAKATAAMPVAAAEPGPMGPMPKHEWQGTKLRFQTPDGWGQFVDLKGAPGKAGKGGGGYIVQSGGTGEGTPGPKGEDASRVLDNETNSDTDSTTIGGSSKASVEMDRAGANTVVLPTRTTDPTLEVRRPYLICQVGAGATTLVAGSGASLQLRDGFTAQLAGQFAVATVMLVDDTTWRVFGDLDAA